MSRPREEMSEFARSLYDAEQSLVTDVTTTANNGTNHNIGTNNDSVEVELSTEDGRPMVHRQPSRRRSSNNRALSSRPFQNGSGGEGQGQGQGDVFASVQHMNRDQQINQRASLPSTLRTRHSDTSTPDHRASTATFPQTNEISWMDNTFLQDGDEKEQSLLWQTNQDKSRGDSQIFTDNDEVLEQYRIMAHLEAALRVKDSIGFDRDEYERKQRSTRQQSTINKGDDYTGGQRPTPKAPLPRLAQGIGGSVTGTFRLQEPPLSFPSRYQNRRRKRVEKIPELCLGVVVPQGGQIRMNDLLDEIVASCYGCTASLRVSNLAGLVRCPDCGTVSPAISTRRKE